MINNISAEFCSPSFLVWLASLATTGKRQSGTSAVQKALVVCIIVSGLLFLLSVGTVAVRLVVREKHFLGRRVNGYWTPNAPLLGSILVGLYACGSIATELVARNHLSPTPTTSLGVLLALVVLLPTTMFLWAWTNAMGVACSFHTLAHEEHRSRWQKKLSPRALNSISVGVPIGVLLILSCILTPALSVVANDMENATFRTLSEYGVNATSEQWQPAIHRCQVADGLYRTIWGLWSLAFLVTAPIYIIYSLMLHSNLQRQVAFLDLDSTTPKTEQPRVLRKERRAQQAEAVSALRALKRNMQLGKIELAAISIYCTPWAGVGLYKLEKGFNVFLNVKDWGGILCLELLLAALCTGVALSVICWRGLNIYSAQRRVRKRATLSRTSVQVTVMTDFHVDTCSGDEEAKASSSLNYSDFPDLAQLAPAPVRLPREERATGNRAIRFEEDGETVGQDEETGWAPPTAWETPPSGQVPLPAPGRGVRQTSSNWSRMSSSDNETSS